MYLVFIAWSAILRGRRIMELHSASPVCQLPLSLPLSHIFSPLKALRCFASLRETYQNITPWFIQPHRKWLKFLHLFITSRTKVLLAQLPSLSLSLKSWCSFTEAGKWLSIHPIYSILHPQPQADAASQLLLPGNKHECWFRCQAMHLWSCGSGSTLWPHSSDLEPPASSSYFEEVDKNSWNWTVALSAFSTLYSLLAHPTGWALHNALSSPLSSFSAFTAFSNRGEK